MNLSTAASLASLLVAILALLVSAVVAVRQLTFLRHSNTLPIAVDLFKEFRDTDFARHKRYIQDQLWEDHPPGDVGLSDLPDQVRDRVVPVSGFFNNAGILFANGIVDGTFLQSFMGGSILRTWWRLRPYIEVDRKRRNDENYYSFYEHLAAHCIKTSPDELRRQLDLESVPPDWIFEAHRYDSRAPRSRARGGGASKRRR